MEWAGWLGGLGGVITWAHRLLEVFPEHRDMSAFIKYKIHAFKRRT